MAAGMSLICRNHVKKRNSQGPREGLVWAPPDISQGLPSNWQRASGYWEIVKGVGEEKEAEEWKDLSLFT